MSDIAGILGEPKAGIDPLADVVPSPANCRSAVFEGSGVAVYHASRTGTASTQPARTSEGALVWIIGDLYGFQGGDGYEPRTDYSISDAEYCATLYDAHGLDCIAGLSGEFAGLIFDHDAAVGHLFTDHIGSIPVFFTHQEHALIFSTRLQAIGRYPDVTPAFDRRYLAEFFGLQKAFGTATVLRDVQKVPPASILTTNRDGTIQTRDRYWQPRYRPIERTPSAIATAIVDGLKEVLTDRLRNDLEYGVLLSGGSDSRLLLGVMRDLGLQPTAFHMTNWMSYEARIAEQVAMRAGVPFEVLRRGPDYHDRLLARVPEFSNFIGAFDESIASGFADELGTVDVVLTGYLGDTLIGTYPLFLPRPARWIHPRFEHEVRSGSDYVAHYLDRYPSSVQTPAFLDAPDVGDVMRSHITAHDGTVRHHGVEYNTFRDLQLGEYYPLTNQFASANSDSLRRITGHWSPFFDRRMIDLAMTIPIAHRIRFDLINMALARAYPSLASIPHSGTGIPPKKSTRTTFGHTVVSELLDVKRRMHRIQPPAPYLHHGPWMDESELIRHRPFIRGSLDRHSERIEALDCLDSTLIDATYREHLDGADHWRSLYTLVTLLESPIAAEIANQSR